MDTLERFSFSRTELVLLLAGMGAKGLWGLYNPEDPDEKDFLASQVRLQASPFLSETEEGIEMDEELYYTLLPMSNPVAHLLFTTGDNQLSQKVFYIGDGITLLEETVGGRVSLARLGIDGFCEEILTNPEVAECLSVMDGYRDFEGSFSAETNFAELRELDTDSLMDDHAVFLLECMDAEGNRTSWLRGRYSGVTAQLDLCGRNCSVLPMTKENLQQLLRALWRNQK